jgi:hypothetical protein
MVIKAIKFTILSTSSLSTQVMASGVAEMRQLRTAKVGSLWEKVAILLHMNICRPNYAENKDIKARH